MNNITKFVSLAGISTLSACGSPSSSTNGINAPAPTTPADTIAQASTGFAAARQTGTAGVTFTKRGTPSIDDTGDYARAVAEGFRFHADRPLASIPFRVDTFDWSTADYSIAFNDDQSEAVFTLNGTAYNLVRGTLYAQRPNDGVYSLTTNSEYVDFGIVARSENLFYIFAGDSTGNRGTRFEDVIGFDTDPTIIAATTGSATYTGDISFAGTSLENEQFKPNGRDPNALPNNLGIIDGQLTLTADFDSNSIGGNAVVTDNDPNMPFTATLAFENTAITGNGFSGNITTNDTLGDPRLTLGDAAYNGNFYGAMGQEVGGNISGEVNVQGGDTIMLTGNFAATTTP